MIIKINIGHYELTPTAETLFLFMDKKVVRDSVKYLEVPDKAWLDEQYSTYLNELFEFVDTFSNEWWKDELKEALQYITPLWLSKVMDEVILSCLSTDQDPDITLLTDLYRMYEDYGPYHFYQQLLKNGAEELHDVKEIDYIEQDIKELLSDAMHNVFLTEGVEPKSPEYQKVEELIQKGEFRELIKMYDKLIES